MEENVVTVRAEYASFLYAFGELVIEDAVQGVPGTGVDIPETDDGKFRYVIPGQNPRNMPVIFSGKDEDGIRREQIVVVKPFFLPERK